MQMSGKRRRPGRLSVPANLLNCCRLIDRLLSSLIISASMAGPSRGGLGFTSTGFGSHVFWWKKNPYIRNQLFLNFSVIITKGFLTRTLEFGYTVLCPDARVSTNVAKCYPLLALLSWFYIACRNIQDVSSDSSLMNFRSLVVPMTIQFWFGIS